MISGRQSIIVVQATETTRKLWWNVWYPSGLLDLPRNTSCISHAAHTHQYWAVLIVQSDKNSPRRLVTVVWMLKAAYLDLFFFWRLTWPIQNYAKNLKMIETSGTNLRLPSESFSINCSMTGFKWFSKNMKLASLCLSFQFVSLAARVRIPDPSPWPSQPVSDHD